jgi:hypothetical protein
MPGGPARIAPNPVPAGLGAGYAAFSRCGIVSDLLLFLFPVSGESVVRGARGTGYCLPLLPAPREKLINPPILPSSAARLPSGHGGGIVPRAVRGRWMLRACLVMLCALPTAGSAQVYQREVYVNGQHLSPSELEQLDLQFGACLADGRYWLDSDTGRWGYEGEPAPRGKVGVLEPQYVGASIGGQDRQPTAPTPPPEADPDRDPIPPRTAE